MRPYLAIAAIVRDEAAHIAEWIAFHQLVGVDRFQLYDNGSTDATVEICQTFDSVQVYDWPGDAAQLGAYGHALGHADARWLAFIDADEFLFSPDYLPLPVALRGYEDYPAVAACWAMYGTGGIEEPRHSTLRAFRWRAVADNVVHRHVKTILQPALVAGAAPADPHVFQCPTVDTLGNGLLGSFAQRTTWKHLRINHYHTRSRQEADAKAQRRRADNGALRGPIDPHGAFNDTLDESLVPYADLVEARLQSRVR